MGRDVALGWNARVSRLRSGLATTPTTHVFPALAAPAVCPPAVSAVSVRRRVSAVPIGRRVAVSIGRRVAAVSIGRRVCVCRCGATRRRAWRTTSTGHCIQVSRSDRGLLGSASAHDGSPDEHVASQLARWCLFRDLSRFGLELIAHHGHRQPGSRRDVQLRYDQVCPRGTSTSLRPPPRGATRT
jgi:hypothetical protein